MGKTEDGKDQAWLARMRRLSIIMLDPALGELAKCVAYRLFDRINRESRKAFPGQLRLAIELSCTDRSIRRALEQLERGGHVSTTHYSSKLRTNEYELIEASKVDLELAEARVEAALPSSRDVRNARKASIGTRTKKSAPKRQKTVSACNNDDKNLNADDRVHNANVLHQSDTVVRVDVIESERHPDMNVRVDLAEINLATRTRMSGPPGRMRPTNPPIEPSQRNALGSEFDHHSYHWI